MIFFYSPVPGSPPENVTVKANSSTTIVVMWGEVLPIDQNGVITMYEVMYTPLEDFGGAIETGLVNITYPYSSVVLTDLEEYVFYNISVRAYTGVGPGNYSIRFAERTDEDGRVLISIMCIPMLEVLPCGMTVALHFVWN